MIRHRFTDTAWLVIAAILVACLYAAGSAIFISTSLITEEQASASVSFGDGNGWG